MDYPTEVASSEIVALNTLGTWYSNGLLQALDASHREYRIHCNTLLQSFDIEYPVFKVVKKRKYHHLMNPAPFGENPLLKFKKGQHGN